MIHNSKKKYGLFQIDWLFHWFQIIFLFHYLFSKCNLCFRRTDTWDNLNLKAAFIFERHIECAAKDQYFYKFQKMIFVQFYSEFDADSESFKVKFVSNLHVRRKIIYGKEKWCRISIKSTLPWLISIFENNQVIHMVGPSYFSFILSVTLIWFVAITTVCC